MTPYQAIVLVHVVFGTAALASFWTAGFARKGSPVHRGAGKVFLLAMCVVLLTGIPLSVQRFLDDRPVEGFFLGYLFVITGQACWMAWHAVRDKADWRAMIARPAWKAWCAGCLLAGIAGFALGLRVGDPVIIVLSTIGPYVAWRMWRFARSGPRRSNWAIVQHYQGIVGAGIATHVAFLGIGMRPVWPLVKQVWPTLPATLVYTFPWFVPLTVATLVLLALNRRYGRLGRPIEPDRA